MGEPWFVDGYHHSQSVPNIQYMSLRESPVAQSSPDRTDSSQEVTEEHEPAADRPVNYIPTAGYHPLFPAYQQDLLSRHGNSQAIITRPLTQAGLPFAVNQGMANFNQVRLVYDGSQPVGFPPVTAYMGSARVDVIRNQPAWRTGISVPIVQSPFGATGTPSHSGLAGPPQQYSTHLAPIRIEGSVNYRGFLPSSYRWNGRAVARDAQEEVVGDRLNSEICRVRRNLPVVLREEELDDSPDTYYAKWNGGYVEVTDDLIARCVCPADLLSYPCRWDELPGGCKMLRLCSQLVKYTNHVCPDAGFRSPDYEGFEDSECPHLHWEVEPSCRFAVKEGKAKVKPGERDPRTCEMANFKYFNCSVGHDLEWGRRVARDRFEYHVRDALMAGAVARVEPHSIIIPRKLHRRMPNGPEPLPHLPY